MSENDLVVLKRALPDYGLVEGDVGAVVHKYEGDAAFEVEFVAADGTTIALVTLEPDDIRPRTSSELLHVREMTC